MVSLHNDRKVTKTLVIIALHITTILIFFYFKIPFRRANNRKNVLDLDLQDIYHSAGQKKYVFCVLAIRQLLIPFLKEYWITSFLWSLEKAMLVDIVQIHLFQHTLSEATGCKKETPVLLSQTRVHVSIKLLLKVLTLLIYLFLVSNIGFQKILGLFCGHILEISILSQLVSIICSFLWHLVQ